MAKKYLDPSGTQYNINEAKQRLANLSQSISALAGVVGDITAEVESLEEGLKPVAFSGSYNDLSGKPTIPDVSSKVSKSGDTMTGDLQFNTVKIVNDSNMIGLEEVAGNEPTSVYAELANFDIDFEPYVDESNLGYGWIRHNPTSTYIGFDFDDRSVTRRKGLFLHGEGENRNYSRIAISDAVNILTDNLYLNSEEVFATTVRYDTPSQGLTDTEKSNAINNLALPNAGFHNSIFRGKYLGSSFTSAQKSAIANGTFDDLFVGDYWTINGVNWRIADIDYIYGYVNTHHLIIVPDTILYNAVWNSTSTTELGYAGSDIYTSGLSSALTSAQNAFGNSYIMEYTNLLTNAVSDGSPTGWADYTIKISLLNQTMLLGHRGASTAYGDYRNDGRNTVQLALFRLCPQYTRCTSWYWLSDVTQNAAAVAYASNLNVFGVTGSRGVRPYFCLKGA